MNKLFYPEIIIHVPNDEGCDSYSLIDNDNQVLMLELLKTIQDKKQLLRLLEIIGSPA